jgi:hypothetical protein
MRDNRGVTPWGYRWGYGEVLAELSRNLSRNPVPPRNPIPSPFGTRGRARGRGLRGVTGGYGGTGITPLTPVTPTLGPPPARRGLENPHALSALHIEWPR